MTEIRFYHLQRSPLEKVLPQILDISLQRGMRSVIIADSDERISALNDHLWTYDADSFLPHGSNQDNFCREQPIYLTTKDENPNQAHLLVLIEGTTSDKLDDYQLVCEFFDGHDDSAVAQARKRWTAYKKAGHDISYFQQDDHGKWLKKA